VSLLAERHESRPYGLVGGEPGASGAAFLLSGGSDGEDDDAADAERLPAKVVRELNAGDVLSVRTPGGGGYGDPADRDESAILRDLRLGKLTPEAAREVYEYEYESEENGTG
jgi:N-methylhydantoinase B